MNDYRFRFRDDLIFKDKRVTDLSWSSEIVNWGCKGLYTCELSYCGTASTRYSYQCISAFSMVKVFKSYRKNNKTNRALLIVIFSNSKATEKERFIGGAVKV